MIDRDTEVATIVAERAAICGMRAPSWRSCRR